MLNILKCDCCGKIAGRIHDLKLFAENSETGEEIWVCGACDDKILAETESA